MYIKFCESAWDFREKNCWKKNLNSHWVRQEAYSWQAMTLNLDFISLFIKHWYHFRILLFIFGWKVQPSGCSVFGLWISRSWIGALAWFFNILTLFLFKAGVKEYFSFAFWSFLSFSSLFLCYIFYFQDTMSLK